MAHIFTETVAMDWKQWAYSSSETCFFHLLDYATRQSILVVKLKYMEGDHGGQVKVWIWIFLIS